MNSMRSEGADAPQIPGVSSTELAAMQDAASSFLAGRGAGPTLRTLQALGESAPADAAGEPCPHQMGYVKVGDGPHWCM